MFTRKTSAVAALAAFSIVLAGCAKPTLTSQQEALATLAGRMDAMGVVPVMPPSEDVRVGDVYAFKIDPRKTANKSQRIAAASRINSTTRFASLPVNEDLRSDYGGRAPFPKTPEMLDGAVDAARTGFAEVETPAGTSVFDNDPTPRRLRIKGLESFTSFAFNSPEITSLVPTEVSTLLNGKAGDQGYNISFRTGSSESYSLPVNDILGLLVEPVADSPPATHRIRAPYRNNLGLLGVPGPTEGSTRIWMGVITEVIYVRSAELDVRAPDAVPPPDTEGESYYAPQPVTQAQDTDGDGQADEPQFDVGQEFVDESHEAFLRAQELNKILVATNADTSTSGILRFLTVTDHSVAMRRFFSRPLAIAVRGILIEVDGTTGDIVDVDTMRWGGALQTEDVIVH